MSYRFVFSLSLLLLLSPSSIIAQNLVKVDKGWANNSINTTVFRKNSIVTHGNYQFTAYYDNDGYVVLAKRKLSEDTWEIRRTQYTGNVKDAHNSISIIVDGRGYLHISWDHHDHPLRYAKSVSPLSIVLGDKEIMTGQNEDKVCYPEFYTQPSGDLIFMYRDGSSGRGNLILNRYDLRSQKWTQIQNNLISGEGKRNAYWQACVDKKGVIHLSWVWRESWLVETNHDMSYARSEDGGLTWLNSKGEKYSLPIIKEFAERVAEIPQNSELINQTSMTTDEDNNPYIATYWRDQDSEVPQYRIVYKNSDGWGVLNTGFRNVGFSLSGGGTKRIPIARPQLIVNGKEKNASLYLFFRDEELGSKVSVASCSNLNNNVWKLNELTTFSVGSWEPTFDTELWKQKRKIHLFVQNVEQVDAEGSAEIEPQNIYILELNHNDLKILNK